MPRATSTWTELKTRNTITKTLVKKEKTINKPVQVQSTPSLYHHFLSQWLVWHCPVFPSTARYNADIFAHFSVPERIPILYGSDLKGFFLAPKWLERAVQLFLAHSDAVYYSTCVYLWNISSVPLENASNGFVVHILRLLLLTLLIKMKCHPRPFVLHCRTSQGNTCKDLMLPIVTKGVLFQRQRTGLLFVSKKTALNIFYCFHMKAEWSCYSFMVT